MALPAWRARVVVRCDCLFSQRSETVFWYESATDPGEVNSAAIAVAAEADAIFRSPFSDVMVQTTQYRGIYAEVYSGGLAGTAELVNPLEGIQALPAAPAYVAALIQLRTEIPGASGRGRRYIPNLSTGMIANGRISVPGPYGPLLAAIAQDINVGGTIFQPRHKYTVGTEEYMIPFTFGTVSQYPATMKSRQTS